MCEPTTIMTTLAVASAATGVYGQDQAARASNRAARQQARHQAAEQQAAAEEELGSRLRERNRAVARARVSGGEAGIAGQSFALGLQQILGDFNQESAVVSKNLAFQQRATQGQLASALASNPRQNALTAGLSIGSAAASGYAGGLQIKGARESLRT